MRISKEEHWEQQQQEEFKTRKEGTTLAQSKKAAYFIDILKKHQAKKVLDLGCNDGGFTMRLEQEGFEAIGMDLPDVVKHAQVATACQFRDKLKHDSFM